jgi:hypothetical protein
MSTSDTTFLDNLAQIVSKDIEPIHIPAVQQEELAFQISQFLMSFLLIFSDDDKEKILDFFKYFLLENADFESFPSELVADFKELSGIDPIEFKKQPKIVDPKVQEQFIEELKKIFNEDDAINFIGDFNSKLLTSTVKGGNRENAKKKISNLDRLIKSGVSNPQYADLLEEVQKNLQEYPDLQNSYNAIFKPTNTTFNTTRNNKKNNQNNSTRKNNGQIYENIKRKIDELYSTEENNENYEMLKYEVKGAIRNYPELQKYYDTKFPPKSWENLSAESSQYPQTMPNLNKNYKNNFGKIKPLQDTGIGGALVNIIQEYKENKNSLSKTSWVLLVAIAASFTAPVIASQGYTTASTMSQNSQPGIQKFNNSYRGVTQNRNNSPDISDTERKNAEAAVELISKEFYSGSQSKKQFPVFQSQNKTVPLTQVQGAFEKVLHAVPETIVNNYNIRNSQQRNTQEEIENIQEANEQLLVTIAQQLPQTVAIEKALDNVPNVQVPVLHDNVILGLTETDTENKNLTMSGTYFTYVDENGIPVTPDAENARFVEVTRDVTNEIVDESLQETLKAYVDPINENVIHFNYNIDGQTNSTAVLMNPEGTSTSISTNVVLADVFLKNSPFTPCPPVVSGGSKRKNAFQTGGTGATICLKTDQTDDEVINILDRNICISENSNYLYITTVKSPHSLRKISIKTLDTDYNKYINGIAEAEGIKYDTNTRKFSYDPKYNIKSEVSLNQVFSNNFESSLHTEFYLTPTQACIKIGTTTVYVDVGSIRMSNISWFKANTKKTTKNKEEIEHFKQIGLKIEEEIPILDISNDITTTTYYIASTSYSLSTPFTINKFRDSDNISKGSLLDPYMNIYFDNKDGKQTLFIFVNNELQKIEFNERKAMKIDKNDNTQATQNNIQKLKTKLEEIGLNYDIYVDENNKLFFNNPVQTYVNNNIKNLLSFKIERIIVNKKPAAKLSASFKIGESEQILSKVVPFEALTNPDKQIDEIKTFCDEQKILRFDETTNQINLELFNKTYTPEEQFENLTEKYLEKDIRYSEEGFGVQLLKPKESWWNSIGKVFGITKQNTLILIEWSKDLAEDKTFPVQIAFLQESILSPAAPGDSTGKLKLYGIPYVFNDAEEILEKRIVSSTEQILPIDMKSVFPVKTSGNALQKLSNHLPKNEKFIGGPSQLNQQKGLTNVSQKGKNISIVQTNSKVQSTQEVHIVSIDFYTKVKQADHSLTEAKQTGIVPKNSNSQAVKKIHFEKSLQEQKSEAKNLYDTNFLETFKTIFGSKIVIEIPSSKKEIFSPSYTGDNHILVTSETKDLNNLDLSSIESVYYEISSWFSDETKNIRINFKGNDNKKYKILLRKKEFEYLVAKLIIDSKSKQGDYLSQIYSLLPESSFDSVLKENLREHMKLLVYEILVSSPDIPFYIIKDFYSTAAEKKISLTIINELLYEKIIYIQQNLLKNILYLEENNKKNPDKTLQESQMSYETTWKILEYFKLNLKSSQPNTTVKNKEQANNLLEASARQSKVEQEAQQSVFIRNLGNVFSYLTGNFKEVLVGSLLGIVILSIILIQFKLKIIDIIKSPATLPKFLLTRAWVLCKRALQISKSIISKKPANIKSSINKILNNLPTRGIENTTANPTRASSTTASSFCKSSAANPTTASSFCKSSAANPTTASSFCKSSAANPTTAISTTAAKVQELLKIDAESKQAIANSRTKHPALPKINNQQVVDGTVSTNLSNKFLIGPMQDLIKLTRGEGDGQGDGQGESIIGKTSPEVQERLTCLNRLIQEHKNKRNLTNPTNPTNPTIVKLSASNRTHQGGKRKTKNRKTKYRKTHKKKSNNK